MASPPQYSLDYYDEDEPIINFVKAHPYPSYEEMVNIIGKDDRTYAEYGEKNHELCKKIYENITDSKIVADCGLAINEMGGFQAMSANYKVLLMYSPFREATNPNVRSAPKQVCSHWDLVGSWRY